MQIKYFAFLVETFQFSKVYENQPKHGKYYNERSLRMVFEVKNV